MTGMTLSPRVQDDKMVFIYNNELLTSSKELSEYIPPYASEASCDALSGVVMPEGAPSGYTIMEEHQKTYRNLSTEKKQECIVQDFSGYHIRQMSPEILLFSPLDGVGTPSIVVNTASKNAQIIYASDLLVSMAKDLVAFV